MNFKRMIKPICKWAAYRKIVGRNRNPLRLELGRFTKRDLRQVLEQTWGRYDQYRNRIPWEPKLGNRMNMRLGCVTIAAYESLRAEGIDEDYAIELIGDMAWVIYEKWGKVSNFLSRLARRTPLERIRLNLRLFLKFPFTSPGYQYEILDVPDAMAFDMHRCPIADYFRAQGLSKLCMHTWCNLDYALAEMWKGHLVRTGTLAMGDECCNFRFMASCTKGTCEDRPGVTMGTAVRI